MTQNLSDSFTHPNASTRKFILAGTFLLLSLPLLASAQMTSSEPMPMNKAVMQGGNTKNNSKSMELQMSMENMHKKMAGMQMTGHTDRDFAMTMREHHQGALDMAQVELQKGKDPQMRKMAANIVAAQKKEIAEFDAWIKKNEASMNTSPQPGK